MSGKVRLGTGAAGLCGVMAGVGLSVLLLGLGAARSESGVRNVRAGLNGATAGDPTGTIAFTAGLGDQGQRFYLIDSQAKSFCIYRVDPRRGSIKLEAARHYRTDMQLAEYNNEPPTVREIETMLRQP